MKESLIRTVFIFVLHYKYCSTPIKINIMHVFMLKILQSSLSVRVMLALLTVYVQECKCQNKVIKMEMATISKGRKMCPIGLKLFREAINWYSELNLLSPPSLAVIKYFLQMPIEFTFLPKNRCRLSQYELKTCSYL